MRLNYFLKPALIISLLTLWGCGGTTKSQEVVLSLIPSNPIVFSSPYTYTNNAGTSVSIQGPWTRFQIGVYVPPSVGEAVTIIHVNAQASGLSAGGTPAFAQSDWDPSLDNYANQSVVCNFQDYGQFDPTGKMVTPTTFSQAYEVSATPYSFNNVVLYEMPTGTSSNCNSFNTPVFYFGGLPAPIVNTPGVVSNYNFSLQITPEGYFGTRSNPTDRFTNSIITSTQ